jgi:hypothetical protein
MHIECHAVLGWAIGNFGQGDARLRRYCTLGALLPDVDGLSYAFGALTYSEYHHTFGHNVFTGLLFCALVTAQGRSWRALCLSFLSFGSHLLTDAWFSGWLLYLFWPFSRKGYLFDHAVDLAHPINLHLLYFSFALVLVLAWVYRRTPLELLSPALDALLVFSLRRRTLRCAVCAGRSNQLCSACGQPVCWSHATVGKGWRLRCPTCARS